MIFDNDDARGWLAELAADGDRAVIRALDALANEDKAPAAAASARALAAAEAVAACRGKPGLSLPDAVTAYAARQESATEERVQRARVAVERVFEESALLAQAEAAGTYDAWEDAVGDLLDRLEPAEGRRMI